MQSREWVRYFVQKHWKTVQPAAWVFEANGIPGSVMFPEEVTAAGRAAKMASTGVITAEMAATTELFGAWPPPDEYPGCPLTWVCMRLQAGAGQDRSGRENPS